MLDFPRTRRTAFLLLLALVSIGPSTLRGQDVLLDTFEDDIAGQPPNGPDIGSYGINNGTHTVIDLGGAKVLQSTAALNEGTSLGWVPIGSPNGRMTVQYVKLIEAGAALDGANSLTHSLLFGVPGQPFPQRVDLFWGVDNNWRLGGQGTPLGTFAFDTPYLVVWDIDLANDRIDLSINGQVLVSQLALSVDISSLGTLVLSANLATAASWRTDDIRATPSALFADDFESGDTSGWSTAVGTGTGDECVDPLPLTEGVTRVGDLVDNTGTSGDDTACGAEDTIDEWLEVTASCTGTLTVTTCLPETTFDTVLAAFDTCGGTQLACNDDDPVGNDPACALDGLNRKSTLGFPVQSGTTYRIRVAPFQDGFPTPTDTGYAISASCTPI